MHDGAATRGPPACLLCRAPASLYCRNDDAFLCAHCDAQVHAGSELLAAHERVPTGCRPTAVQPPLPDLTPHEQSNWLRHVHAMHGPGAGGQRGTALSEAADAVASAAAAVQQQQQQQYKGCLLSPGTRAPLAASPFCFFSKQLQPPPPLPAGAQREAGGWAHAAATASGSAPSLPGLPRDVTNASADSEGTRWEGLPPPPPPPLAAPSRRGSLDAALMECLESMTGLDGFECVAANASRLLAAHRAAGAAMPLLHPAQPADSQGLEGASDDDGSSGDGCEATSGGAPPPPVATFEPPLLRRVVAAAAAAAHEQQQRESRRRRQQELLDQLPPELRQEADRLLRGAERPQHSAAMQHHQHRLAAAMQQQRQQQHAAATQQQQQQRWASVVTTGLRGGSGGCTPPPGAAASAADSLPDFAGAGGTWGELGRAHSGLPLSASGPLLRSGGAQPSLPAAPAAVTTGGGFGAAAALRKHAVGAPAGQGTRERARNRSGASGAGTPRGASKGLAGRRQHGRARAGSLRPAPGTLPSPAAQHAQPEPQAQARARRAAAEAAAAAVLIPPYRDDESRADKLARYRAKKLKRSFNPTVRYECRKHYADRRPRIRGRFVSPEEFAAWQAGEGPSGEEAGAAADQRSPPSVAIPSVARAAC